MNRNIKKGKENKNTTKEATTRTTETEKEQWQPRTNHKPSKGSDGQTEDTEAPPSRLESIRTCSQHADAPRILNKGGTQAIAVCAPSSRPLPLPSNRKCKEAYPRVPRTRERRPDRGTRTTGDRVTSSPMYLPSTPPAGIMPTTRILKNHTTWRTTAVDPWIDCAPTPTKFPHKNKYIYIGRPST